jgi:hypothetical protein
VSRIGFAVAAIIGAGVGIFWLIAIDAGVNGARWPPNWHSSLAYLTCPFIPLVGLNTLANVLVPVLNALVYGFVVWCALRFRRST